MNTFKKAERKNLKQNFERESRENTREAETEMGKAGKIDVTHTGGEL
jgi:hypothetical protein